LTSRPVAILFALTFYTMGAIIIAASHTVSAVCVGMVIFASGATGIDFRKYDSMATEHCD
jgi:fucose permease